MLLLSACSTKKNTFTRRAYHNLTAHYNVYWNGMDNMRTGTKEFEATVKDNYALVLPVFNFGDKSSSAKMNQYSDMAIKKASKTITKHSMYFNHKEYNKWIDDSYMLIGRAYFYKQDYPMARRTFEFVIKTYNTSDIKYEAMIWQAMSNMQLGDFSRAEPMLDMVQNMIRQGKAPEKYLKMLTLVNANFYILQKNYPLALDYLNDALDFSLKRSMRSRLMFIIGQIHQKNGELELASQYYSKVIKRNPGFEMEFNAKINMAQCYMGKTGDREFIVKKLNKMLKDEKNKDYQDQIYYALASISLRDGDTTETVNLLTKSVAKSSSNNYQKAISALDLADLYFAQKKYRPAQAYYDSTMQFLPKDFSNYKEIRIKTETLTDLVNNLTIVEREDSLQKLAKMSDSERNAVIDKIIAVLVEEEQRKAKEEQERMENQFLLMQSGQGGQGGPGSSIPGAGAGVGSWYFYNPATLANGFSTFAKKWGRRKLEDDWFLSNKTISSFSNEIVENADTATTDSTGGKPVSKEASDPKKRDFYLKDIPATPEMLKASNDSLIQALYSLGFIYVEGLGDYPRSIESFESLLTRFPGNKYTVASNYQLYKLYLDLDNQAQSDVYKNVLLTTYPESDFAKLIVNPSYYKELQGKKKEATTLYEDTYTAFRNQQYYMVINNAAIAMEKYPADSALFPKFEYLKALSLGKIEVEDSLVSAMQKIITRYPKSEVRPMAEKVLAMLGKTQGGQAIKPPGTAPGDTTKNAPLPAPVEKLYSYIPGAVHFFVLLVDGKLVDVNALKIKISDFNTRFYDLDNLQVNSILLDGTREMVTVSNFDNAEKGLGYYIAINESKYIFTKLESSGYDDFIISTENYPVFYKNKDVKQYLQFFQKSYGVTK